MSYQLKLWNRITSNDPRVGPTCPTTQAAELTLVVLQCPTTQAVEHRVTSNDPRVGPTCPPTQAAEQITFNDNDSSCGSNWTWRYLHPDIEWRPTTQAVEQSHWTPCPSTQAMEQVRSLPMIPTCSITQVVGSNWTWGGASIWIFTGVLQLKLWNSPIELLVLLYMLQLERYWPGNWSWTPPCPGTCTFGSELGLSIKYPYVMSCNSSCGTDFIQ
jgi:hypothetical protein